MFSGLFDVSDTWRSQSELRRPHKPSVWRLDPGRWAVLSHLPNLPNFWPFCPKDNDWIRVTSLAWPGSDDFDGTPEASRILKMFVRFQAAAPQKFPSRRHAELLKILLKLGSDISDAWTRNGSRKTKWSSITGPCGLPTLQSGFCRWHELWTDKQASYCCVPTKWRVHQVWWASQWSPRIHSTEEMLIDQVFCQVSCVQEAARF